MSKPHKPVRQEYIAKVRYINNLPPPPLNPKFVKYNTTEKTSSKTESEQLLSSLFRRENFLSLIECIDEDHGMNLNLLNNSGFLDNADESKIYKFVGEPGRDDDNKHVVLHPKDLALLRDAGIDKISRSEFNVSFLRRTEYISERQLPKASSGHVNGAENGVNKSIEEFKKVEDSHDPEAQLRAVEKTFDAAQDSLQNFDTLKHPKKKGLKAVAAWPFLPDTSMMDTKFLTVKFSGSASISRELEALKRQQGSSFDSELHENALKSGILRPITSEDGEWMSMYQVKNSDDAAEVVEKLNSEEKERQVYALDEQDDVKACEFHHSKNYDMSFHRFQKPYEELCIKFVSDGNGNGNGKSNKRKAAYYYPVTGRIDLKKHRASTNAEINRFVRESTADVINFRLREPDTNELKRMDTLRSEFDPMEYEGEEDIPDEIEDLEKSTAEQRDASEDQIEERNGSEDQNNEDQPRERSPTQEIKNEEVNQG